MVEVWIACLAGCAATVIVREAASVLGGRGRACVMPFVGRVRAWWGFLPSRRAPSGDLPGFLLDLADGVRVGLDLAMALRSMSKKGAMGRRIEMAIAAYDLGVPLLDALDTVLSPEGDEGRVVRRVLETVSGTGGNIAPMLAVLAESIERRRLLRRELLARSVEGRYSAWALAVLPVLVVAAMVEWFPDMVAPLFDSATGRWSAVYAVGSWAAGTAMSFFMVRGAGRQGKGSWA